MFDFVHHQSDGSRLNASALKTVRSRAMRNFRRRQRALTPEDATEDAVVGVSSAEIAWRDHRQSLRHATSRLSAGATDSTPAHSFASKAPREPSSKRKRTLMDQTSSGPLPKGSEVLESFESSNQIIETAHAQDEASHSSFQSSDLSLAISKVSGVGSVLLPSTYTRKQTEKPANQTECLLPGHAAGCTSRFIMYYIPSAAPHAKQLPTLKSQHVTGDGMRDESLTLPKAVGRFNLSEDQEKDALQLAATCRAYLYRGDAPRNRQWCRTQYHDAFINSYYSGSVRHSTNKFIRAYHYAAPESMAMNASRDALCLIYLGTRYLDHRILMEGRKIHLIALRCIRESIQKPGAVIDDSVLGACYYAAHCEIFQVISQEGKGWQLHMAGLYLILQHLGRKSLNSNFAQAIFHNIRQIAVMDQLLNRKSSFLSSAEWSGGPKESHTPAIRLTNIALQISGVLEASDLMTAQMAPSQSEISHLLEDIMGLDCEVRQWLSEFRQSEFQKTANRLVSISRYRSLQERLGILSEIVSTVWEFPTFVSATSHAYAWICLLTLRQSAVDLVMHYTSPTHLQLFSKIALVARAEECADHLCRSLAFLSAEEHSSAGLLACSGPLHFAAKWYERQGDIQRLEWIGQVRDILERDELTNGPYKTSLNFRRPVLTWWMLPNIFIDENVNSSLPAVTARRR